MCKSFGVDRVRPALVAVLAGLVPMVAMAQSAPGPGLTDSRLEYANGVERAAAAANQFTFTQLDTQCNPGGIFDQVASPDPARAPTTCNGSEFLVYLTIRELVHSANELLGEGPTVASLGLNQQDLGGALRWTAAEELAVQGSMATQFSNSQLSNLAGRINALRFGTRGFSIAGLQDIREHGEPVLAQIERTDTPRGGGASADLGASYSRWGGFVNGAFGWGSKSPTGNEDAFDFDGSELTLGVDYRFANNFVLGGIFGVGEQTVDFDEGASDIIVVDGGVEADANSFILFSLYNGEKLSVSGSLGYQTLDYDVERNIKYPSFNPDVDAADSTALSSPESDIVTATFGFGYSFNLGRFTIEPYLNAEYFDITIDEFSENRSIESLGGLIDDDAFNLTIAEQTFESLDVATGLKIQATLTPGFAVLVPYATFESHREFEDDGRVIRARYGAASSVSQFVFEVPTDPLDESYFVWTVGLSAVIRGGRQRSGSGPITGGLMGFIQYRSIENLDNYEDEVITGGIRYEF